MEHFLVKLNVPHTVTSVVAYIFDIMPLQHLDVVLVVAHEFLSTLRVYSVVLEWKLIAQNGRYIFKVFSQA